MPWAVLCRRAADEADDRSFIDFVRTEAFSPVCGRSPLTHGTRPGCYYPGEPMLYLRVASRLSWYLNVAWSSCRADPAW